MSDLPNIRLARYRNGRKVRRTLYLQQGPGPDDSDPLVGVMDTPELAALVVEALNVRAALAEAGWTPPQEAGDA